MLNIINLHNSARGRRNSQHAPSVREVLEVAAPFKVVGSVVEFVTVNVVYIRASLNSIVKGLSHKAMNFLFDTAPFACRIPTLTGFAVPAKSDPDIAVGINIPLGDAPRATNRSKGACFVSGEVRDCAPFFSHKNGYADMASVKQGEL